MNVSIHSRLSATVLCLVALPVVIVALNVAHARSHTGDAVKVDYAGSERMRAFMTAALTAEHLRTPTEETRDRIEREMEMWERVRRGLLDGDAQLDLKRTDDLALRSELERAGEEFRGYRAAVARATDPTVARNASAASSEAHAVLQGAFGLYDRLDRVTRGLQQQSERSVAQFLGVQVVLAAAVGLVALAALIGSRRFVLRPLPRFMAAMKAIAHGELRARVPEKGPSELIEVAHAFNTMGSALLQARSKLVGHEQELAAKNQELEHANRLKSEFLANMSHELRTPLNAVLGYSALLRREIYGPLNGAQHEALEGIAETGGHLLELINDVLDLSKIEAGKMQLRFEPVDLRAMAGELSRSMEPLARNKGLVLRHVEPRGNLTVRTDGEKVRRILLNFLSNAVKFTKSGFVELRAVEQTATDEIELAVWDTGIGVGPEDLAHIFEDFRQSDGSPSREFGGTGLGLSISLRLARMIGARIEVETAVGSGSTFTLVLPREPRPHAGGEVRFHEHARV